MNSKTQKITFLVIWCALLGFGFYMIQRLVEHPDGPVAPPVPQIASKIISDNWDGILRHAVSPPKGSATAPYTIVEFGDFACPQCGAMRSTIEGLTTSAPVNLYFVNRPFPQLVEHKYAVVAAEAGYSAAAQGKFWPMYDTLYSHQDNLQPGFYEDYANAIGLDGKSLQRDVDSKRYLSKVNESKAFCDKLTVVVTPTICIRDNKTGKVQVASGKVHITELLNEAPWAMSGTAVAGVSPLESGAGSSSSSKSAADLLAKGQ